MENNFGSSFYVCFRILAALIASAPSHEIVKTLTRIVGYCISNIDFSDRGLKKYNEVVSNYCHFFRRGVIKEAKQEKLVIDNTRQPY